MKDVKIAIIGGTGIGDRLQSLGGLETSIETPYGPISAIKLTHEGVELILLSRHSAGHKVPPHLVNYRGMATALKQLKVKACLATAAVGSLRPEWGPGTLVACSDFIDMTGRNLTLFDEVVEHRDFSDPFDPAARSALVEVARESSVPVETEGVYLSANGPRYETPAEIRMYQRWGADVVGMTAASEAVLMREALVPYACLAIVTNLGCGISQTPVNHQEVVDEMKRTGDTVVKLLLATAQRIANS